MKEEIENPFVHAYAYGTDNYDRVQEGITLRDELAKTAMLGFLTRYGTHSVSLSIKDISALSYEIADEMLKQRLL